ncbi:MAG: hypothetical protein HWN66_06935 [Candidatus Helarchaeota archaeon]|nr:hypothetical protein [Candidatus Helarchaeota archaeon]
MGRIELLRLDYLFSVLAPCLLAIYVNNLNIVNYLGIISGWCFLGVTGNLLNDAIDKDRGLDYTTKELATLALISFLLGIALMVETFIYYPITIAFALSSIFLVIGYCVKFKQYAIINKFVLVFSHIVFPYLTIISSPQVNPNLLSWGEIWIMATFFAFSFSGQVIHEAIDKEASDAFSLRKIQIIVQISSILTIIFGVYAIFVLPQPNSLYFIPFIAIPVGPMYIYRKPRTPRPELKDVGIILGNLMMVYLLVLILMG